MVHSGAVHVVNLSSDLEDESRDFDNSFGDGGSTTSGSYVIEADHFCQDLCDFSIEDTEV